MKKMLLFFLVLTLVAPSFAQDISGRWEGKLSVQGQSLRIVFNLVQTESTVLATMDSFTEVLELMTQWISSKTQK